MTTARESGFIDDPGQEVFGLQDATFLPTRPLTVDGVVEDARLTMLPAYLAPDE